MYLPQHFREENPEKLQTLLREYSFATLVSWHDGLPFASHLPLLFEKDSAGNGKLLGHMARANPQWLSFENKQPVLAIFHGPHAYVSPSWYATPGVPTWNYAVVHVYGKPRLIEEKENLWQLIVRLTDIYEAAQPQPWKPDMPEDRRAKLLEMIVGFEIEIEQIQGKFKLSQNRSLEDQSRVIEQLRQGGSFDSSPLANLMESKLVKRARST